MMKYLSLLSTVALSALLLGCAVGPDYQKPDDPLPQDWTAQQDPSVQKAEDAEQCAWWENFHDPVLTKLVQQAVSGNLDLKVAEARIAEARAARSTAQAALLPTGDAKFQGNRVDIPAGGFPGLSGPLDIFQSGFDASWEVDVFGGHRRAVEQASAQEQAAKVTRDEAIVSLLAEVARTYTDIRQYQKQLNLAEDIIKSDQSSLRIAKERFDAGQAPGIDVEQAQAQLEQVESQIPYYRNALAQAEYSMDVLLGQQPGAAQAVITAAPEASAEIPKTDKTLLLAAPSKVISNRPDIAVAERNLAAATAQQGVAVAQFFPDISLSGFVGLFNEHLSDLPKRASGFWYAGSSVTWPILSYPKLQANLDSANAQQQEAMMNYRKAIIEALSDVDKSVTSYIEQQKFEEALGKSVAHDRKAYQIAQARYKEGLTSFLEVLDAERTLNNAQVQYTEAEAKTTTDLIAAYKSLGGGWVAKQN